MRNPDPRVTVVSAQRHNSDLNSMFMVQIAGCNFQYGPQFWCLLGSSLSVVMLLLLLKEWASVLNCVRSPVSFVMKYCPFSTTLRNPASIQNLLNLSCCDGFSISFSFICNRKKPDSLGHHYQKRTSVLIALSTIDCTITTSRSVLS